MSLIAIVRALGGDLYAGGRRANVPAPGHSPADRSVSLLLDGDRVVIHSFGAAHWREVRDGLRRLGLVDAAGRLIGAAPLAGPPRPTPLRFERTAAARALWDESSPALRGPAARHLALRAVGRQASAALRSHPAAPVALYAGAGRRLAALVAAISAPTGELTAVEVSYLGPNGARARLRTPRKTIGVLPQGAAVRLDPAGPELLVGEGVFTALSAGELFGLPAWALLSAGALARWTPPAGVRQVLIAGDRGAVGEAAAAQLALGLACGGVRARILLPPAPFGDWNEVACARRTGCAAATDAEGPPPGAAEAGSAWPGAPRPARDAALCRPCRPRRPPGRAAVGFGPWLHGGSHDAFDPRPIRSFARRSARRLDRRPRPSRPLSDRG